MRIECLDDVPGIGQIVRLTGFTPAEAQRLQSAVLQLVCGALEHIDLQTIEIEDPARGRWSFDSGETDVGLCASNAGRSWRLTRASWDNVAGLMEPFVSGPQLSHRYQWLSQSGDASLLISVDGDW